MPARSSASCRNAVCEFQICSMQGHRLVRNTYLLTVAEKMRAYSYDSLS